MKVTKFPQSCLLLEKDHQKIVIDPGDVFLKSHDVSELKGVAAVLYTHQHADHYEPTIAAAFKEWGVALYANADTAALIGDHAQVVHDTDTFEVAGFTVQARELPHCLLANGAAGPQNTGYVIDDILFHPGDGKELADFTVDNLALPLVGPDISVLDAINFAKQVQAKVVVPIHYDAIPFSPEVFAVYAERGQGTFEVRILADGASTTV